MIPCATFRYSAPIQMEFASYRRRISLPCSILKLPTIDGEPVFITKDLVGKVVVDDCGGHGRALEALADAFQALQVLIMI